MLVIGDSVILSAEQHFDGLRRWIAQVDARGCRQATVRADGCGATDIPSALDAVKGGVDPLAPDCVVFHIGHNGRIEPEQFDQIMRAVPEATTAAWLTLNEPREWERPNNLDIAAGVERWPGTVLIDWKAMSTGKPWFQPDDLHLNDAGATALVRVINREMTKAVRAAARL